MQIYFNAREEHGALVLMRCMNDIDSDRDRDNSSLHYFICRYRTSAGPNWFSSASTVTAPAKYHSFFLFKTLGSRCLSRVIKFLLSEILSNEKYHVNRTDV